MLSLCTRFAVLSVFVFTLQGTFAAPKPLPNGISYVTSVEGITEYRLDNGLIVLLLADASKPVVTVNMTYRVGSKHENYGETGMAHLLEHLMFKGTPTLPDFAQTMKQKGMQWNGTTYYDRTNYYETFSATDENLTWAIAMEADRMVNSFIAKQDLDSEMTVVRNELERGENSPHRVLGQRMMAAAFDWHNYAKPTIGAVSDLENVDIFKLKAFYKTYYQPDNAVLTIAGRFDAERVLNWVSDHFAKIPKPSRSLPSLYTVEPTQDGEKQVTVKRAGSAPLLSIQYHAPAAAHPDVPALLLLANILGTEPSGRLYQALDAAGLAAQSYAWLNTLAERSVLIVGLSLEPKHDLSRAQAALVQTIQTPQPFTQEELNRAQQEFETDFNQMLQRPQTLAVALSESIGQGDWRLMFATREAIKRTGLADIARVAAAYLKTDNRTVGIFTPTSTPDRTLITQAPSAKTVADNTTFKATQMGGEQFDPTPQALEARVIRKKLTDSIQWAYLPKSNRGNTVQMRVKLRWGSTELINQAQLHAAAPWVGPMLLEGSTGFNKQALTDALSKLQSKLLLNSGPLGADISIETTQEHTSAVISLFETVLKKPLFDSVAFERLRSAKLANLLAKLSTPEEAASARLAQHTNQALGLQQTDWRYSKSVQEQINDLKKLSINDIQRYYQLYWTTKGALLSVVGNVNGQIEPQVQAALAHWSASPQAAALSYVRPINSYIPVPAMNVELKTPDKANAVYLEQGVFNLSRSDLQYWPMQIASNILGADQFNSRIGKRVRVKEGLSYSAYSYIDVDTRDNRAIYLASASFAPQNLHKVQRAMQEELTRFIHDGITQQELADTQANLLQSLEQQRSSDEYLSRHLIYQLETGETFELHQQHISRIQSATVQSINEAIKTHFAQMPLSQVVAGDFK